MVTDDRREQRRKEALERAESVWPLSGHVASPCDDDSIASFLSREGVVECEDVEDLLDDTLIPRLYHAQAIRARLADMLRRLPREFLSIFLDGRRAIRFYITPGDTFNGTNTTTFPVGSARDRRYTIFLKRDAVEAEDSMVFDGIVVHELCHIVLDHPASPAWPEDKSERQRFINMIENEALTVAVSIGFREETAAYIRHGSLAYGWSDEIIDSFLRVLDSSPDPETL